MPEFLKKQGKFKLKKLGSLVFERIKSYLNYFSDYCFTYR
ncbi:MAG: hypothetical protein ACI9XO_000324 [Paraglaciecola sp.]|jgi:hypothetical protein